MKEIFDVLLRVLQAISIPAFLCFLGFVFVFCSNDNDS